MTGSDRGPSGTGRVCLCVICVSQGACEWGRVRCAVGAVLPRGAGVYATSAARSLCGINTTQSVHVFGIVLSKYYVFLSVFTRPCSAPLVHGSVRMWQYWYTSEAQNIDHAYLQFRAYTYSVNDIQQ
jgi:hypothetical protein